MLISGSSVGTPHSMVDFWSTSADCTRQRIGMDQLGRSRPAAGSGRLKFERVKHRTEFRASSTATASAPPLFPVPLLCSEQFCSAVTSANSWTEITSDCKESNSSSKQKDFRVGSIRGRGDRVWHAWRRRQRRRIAHSIARLQRHGLATAGR